MNDRIQELAKQARNSLTVDAMSGGEFNMKAYEQKFAELIQKDMIKQCRDMFIVDSVSWNLLNEKLELFGVE